MAGKYEIKKGKGGYRFNLKAPNGQTILSSEQYTTKSGAQTGIASVKANARSKAHFEERNAKNGETYFVLKAKNGEIIGRSETYASPSGRKNGIESVQRNAGAKIDDKS
ncbi:MAG: YegP family protein [Acidobacteriota bacterium]